MEKAAAAAAGAGGGGGGEEGIWSRLGQMPPNVKLLITSKLRECLSVGRYLKVWYTQEERERLVSDEEGHLNTYSHLAQALFLRGGASELQKRLASGDIIIQGHTLAVDAHQLLSWERLWLESSLIYLQLMTAWELVDEVRFETVKVISSRSYYSCYYVSGVERVPFHMFKKHFLPAITSSRSSSSRRKKTSRLGKITFDTTDKAEALEGRIPTLKWMYNI